MDFFVSKVAMSICALVVVAVLSGVTDSHMFIDDAHEVDAVLEDFCAAAERAMGERIEGNLRWKVPALPTGQEIELELDHGLVRSHWNGKSVVRQPLTFVHTWTWDGLSLNESAIKDLDRGSQPLVARTGNSVLLTTSYVLFENDRKLLVFASAELG